MKQAFIVIVLAVFCLSPAKGYNSDTPMDSMWQYVRELYRSNQLDSALHYAYQLEQMALKKGNERYLPKAKLIIAKVHEKRNEKESVLLFYDLLEASERINDPQALGSANLNLGQIFTRAYEYDYAIGHLKEAYRQYGLAGEPNNQSAVLYEIARSYLNRNMPDSAKPYLIRALELNPAQYPVRTGKIFNNLGRCAVQSGNYPLARYYYLTALRYVKRTDTLKYAIAYNNVGEAYFFEGKIKEAEHWLEMALALKRSLGKPTFTLSTFILLAKIHHQQENIAVALDLLNEGLMTVERNDVNTNTMEALHLVTELVKKHSDVHLPPSLLNQYLAMATDQNLALTKQKDTLNEFSVRYNVQIMIKEYLKIKKAKLHKEQVELQGEMVKLRSEMGKLTGKAFEEKFIMIMVAATILLITIYLFYERYKRLKLESNNLVQDSMQKLRDATLEKLISEADYEAIRRRLRLRGDQDT